MTDDGCNRRLLGIIDGWQQPHLSHTPFHQWASYALGHQRDNWHDSR
ncbi:MAG: hypothetical protein CM15mP120_00340 [Pseudomonadota bacterium]|nr:MAG: hypothetical protein CM15mP120_00340 [Pseudomonadota bacterium]